MFAHLDRLHEDDEEAVIPAEVTLRARKDADGVLNVPGMSVLYVDPCPREIQRYFDSLKNSEAAQVLHQNVKRAAHASFNLNVTVKVPSAVAHAAGL